MVSVFRIRDNTAYGIGQALNSRRSRLAPDRGDRYNDYCIMSADGFGPGALHDSLCIGWYYVRRLYTDAGGICQPIAALEGL